MSGALHPVASGEPHAVLLGATALRGHAAEAPVQSSAGSQVGSAPAARHCVDGDESWSAGQVTLLPVQFSAGSQTPVDVRHTVLAALNWPAPLAGTQRLEPVLQSMTPFSQRFAVLHATPGVHAPMPPSPSQNDEVSTCTPASTLATTVHTGPPLAQAVEAMRQAPASQAALSAQLTRPPSPSHTAAGVT